VLDNPFASVLYSGCVPGQQRTEQICDYFAGCLLMPRPWLKAAWASGLQDVGSLARLFNVSQLAMRVRLLQVGLIHNSARWERAA
jgi:Zn-dependent peptidase ImmA (M78 family)